MVASSLDTLIFDLSAEQVVIFNSVVERGEVPLQEFVDHIDDLHELISRHLLGLKISMQSWGVDYLVTRAKTTQGLNLEAK